MENPGKMPLTLIEIQTGSYFGEDDIIRYEEVYARDQGAKGWIFTAPLAASRSNGTRPIFLLARLITPKHCARLSPDTETRR